MDIDCDGANNGKGDCANDPSGQSMTAFKDTVASYGIEDLDSNVHTYVVLGNDNSASEGDGGQKFDPQEHGVKPLSVLAVVCGDKLVYGVWGDVNGGKVTGESSISLAQMCFPDEKITGDSGHGEHDVMYIAFQGEDAVAGDSANWKAKSREEFEASLATIGDKLVAQLGDGGVVVPPTGPGGNGTIPGGPTGNSTLPGNSTIPGNGTTGWNHTVHHHHHGPPKPKKTISRVMRAMFDVDI
jgi:chitosanase